MENTTLADIDEYFEGEDSKSLSSHDGEVYPNADVRVSKEQYSLLHVKRLVEDRKELLIAPDFQRKDVWKPRQRVELVESIIMGIPLPVIYLFESADGKKQVVDGRQRITTIIDFLNDDFQLKDLNILPQYNNKRFSDLPPKIQGIFEDYQIFCYVIQPPTPERVKYDIFDRVNRGGTILNSQEMRWALYQGHATKIIDEICRSEEFLLATGNAVSPKRMRDRYAALRILAFFLLFSNQLEGDGLENPIEYKSDMDDFLAKVMVRINAKSSESQRFEWKKNILDAFKELYNLLGPDAFRFDSIHEGKKRPLNMPLMEALTFLFILKWKRPHEESLCNEISGLKKQLDKSGRFRSKVDSSVSVHLRFNWMKEFAERGSSNVLTEENDD